MNQRQSQARPCATPADLDWHHGCCVAIRRIFHVTGIAQDKLASPDTSYGPDSTGDIRNVSKTVAVNQRPDGQPTRLRGPQ